jgi:hypothetical protein
VISTGEDFAVYGPWPITLTAATRKTYVVAPERPVTVAEVEELVPSENVFHELPSSEEY